MTPTFWTLTSGVGVAQGAFLITALLLRPGENRRASLSFVAIVGVLTTLTGLELAARTTSVREGWLLPYLGVNVELALGPLFLLFVRALLEPERQPSWRDATYFVPLVAGLAFWGTMWAAVEDRSRPFGVGVDALVLGFLGFKACVLGAFLWAAFDLLRPRLQEARVFAIGRRRVGARWLAWTILGAILGVGSIYVVNVLDHLNAGLPFEPDELSSLVVMATIYGLSFALFLWPWLLSLKAQPATAATWHSDRAHLQAVLERRRPWLDPELDLEALATATGFTESRLSALINDGLQTTFYGMLGRYRLAEFERLARDPGLADRTVLELALCAGFNSKASFYRKFREVHGMTPGAWRTRCSTSH